MDSSIWNLKYLFSSEVTLVHRWWDCKLVQPPQETVWDPTIPLLGIDPKKTRALTRKDICLPMLTAVWFTTAKTHMDKWIKRVWCIYTMEYYSARKKHMEILPLCNNMKGLWRYPAAKLLQSCPTLCDPIDGSPPGSLSLGFSRQEHWSGLPLPSPMQESEKWK